MILTYKYRIYPSSKQIEKIGHNFAVCKEVYNKLLELNVPETNLLF